MQDTSRLIINHIRIMIEEAEHAKSGVKVCFVCLVIHIIVTCCNCLS